MNNWIDLKPKYCCPSRPGLPTIFDEGMSYEEQVCDLIKDYNNVVIDINLLKNYYQNINNYPYVKQIIDEMADSGELADIMYKYQSPICIYGHRGYTRNSSLFARDNSPWSVCYAKNVGCDGVEIDVRYDVNGTYVCLHDRNVSSISNQTGNIDELNSANVTYNTRWLQDTGIPLMTVAQCAKLCNNLGLRILFDMGKIGSEHVLPVSQVCESVGFKNYGFYALDDYSPNPDYSVFSKLPGYVKKICDLRQDNYSAADIENILNSFGTKQNVGFRIYRTGINLNQSALDFIYSNGLELGATNFETAEKYLCTWGIFEGVYVTPDDATSHYSALAYRSINGVIGGGENPQDVTQSLKERMLTQGYGGNTQRITVGNVTGNKQSIVTPELSGSSGVIYQITGSDGYGSFALLQSRSPYTPLRVMHGEVSRDIVTLYNLEGNFSYMDTDLGTFTTAMAYINAMIAKVQQSLKYTMIKAQCYLSGNIAANITDIPGESKGNGIFLEISAGGLDTSTPWGVFRATIRRKPNVIEGWFENNQLYFNSP